MSILSRFKDIMSSNINAMLDKMEDPSKMIDQMLRDLNDDLGQVKSETAAIMAEERRSKRQLNECQDNIDKMQSYAEKAVSAGNDSDAKLFLSKKTSFQTQYDSLNTAYQAAAANATKMREMHDKLIVQINELDGRREAVKAKVSVAKAQERINSIGSKATHASNTMDSFARMEEKADNMLDRASAMAELNAINANDTLENAMDKYDAVPSSDVDAELLALKQKMGKE
ncbi:MAG: PspA/IM30 family protein [Clostridia bacterium]